MGEPNKIIKGLSIRFTNQYLTESNMNNQISIKIF